MRRAIDLVATTPSSTVSSRLRALDELQKTLNLTRQQAQSWEREVRRASEEFASPRMAQTIIHLDTSFLIRALVAGSGEASELRGWLAGGAEVGISTVGWTEFLCGPLDLRQLAFATTVTGEPVPFLAEDAVRSAELFNQTGRRGGWLLDCKIAAVAIGTNASPATTNRAVFQRFQGLRPA